MNLTLRQLSYFRALAQQRHFGRAAEVVNVSQPALSVQIRDMEASLGQPLVERRPRDVVLTPFGRMILRHAERVLEDMQALSEAARWREGLSGRLNLGVIPTIAPYILPDVLEALRSDDISLDVHVQEAKTDRLIPLLLSGQLDAAVMALPVADEGLVGAALFEDRFMLAGSAMRLDALGPMTETLRPTELGQVPLLLLEDGHCLTDQALDVCGRDRTHAQIDMGASSLPTVSRLVAAGFGLTLIPELAAPTEARASPGMHLMRFSAPEPCRQIGLVRRASSSPESWFSELTGVLSVVGARLVQLARDEWGGSDGKSARTKKVRAVNTKQP